MTDVALAEQLLQEVSSYLRPDEVELVREAIAFARAAHIDQVRKSGEPYITHPIEVARILAQLHLDVPAIVAALLHDVAEDTDISPEEIAAKFGQPVRELVDGLTKLDSFDFESRLHAQAENFRKMLLAMAQDVRVVLVKLADRLHNMRTLGAMPDHKQQRIAEETLQIYAQIAYRMGLHGIYQELQELSFRYLYPTEYAELSENLAAKVKRRGRTLDRVQRALQEQLTKQNVVAEVTEVRRKSLYSIFKKMKDKNLKFSEISDVFACRVLVKERLDCYLALGILHSLYKPVPGKFKDYIAIPKENGYESLHSTLTIPPDKEIKTHPNYQPDLPPETEIPIEVQIRTYDMHRLADVGVASHWLYKSGDNRSKQAIQKHHQWLKDLLEHLSHSSDSSEFMEHLRYDLYPDEVYVLTPKGDIRALPRGATALDFAYNLHEKIGHQCFATKINKENAPLRTVLHTGDSVEIVTNPVATPKRDWLEFVTTGRARAYIQRYFKMVQSEEVIKFGKRMLDDALRSLKITPQSITEEQWTKVLRSTKVKSQGEMWTDIGLGKRHCMLVARQLARIGELSTPLPDVPITIQGTEGMAVKFCPCCSPIPGDPIIGEFHQTQGLIVHAESCTELQRGHSRGIEWSSVKWAENIANRFLVNLKVLTTHEPGVLGKVSTAIGNAGYNIQNLGMENEDQYAVLMFTLEVSNRAELSIVMNTVSKLPEVVRVKRMSSCAPAKKNA